MSSIFLGSILTPLYTPMHIVCYNCINSHIQVSCNLLTTVIFFKFSIDKQFFNVLNLYTQYNKINIE